MPTHTVTFRPELGAPLGSLPGSGEVAVEVPAGSTLSEAARLAGFDVNQPCGGQGRCGRCAVVVDDAAWRPDGLPRSAVRRRSTIRLSEEDLETGYALACQTVIEGPAWVTIPRQEAIERRLVTQKAAARVVLPFDYNPDLHQSVRRYFLRLDPPDLSDQTDDWSRVVRSLAPFGIDAPSTSLPVLQSLGATLRTPDAITGDDEQAASEPWEVTAVVARSAWDLPAGPPEVLAVIPGDQVDRNLGAAIDIGTTTVTVWLVDLESGEVLAQAGDYNGQIARGEDVISRIIYARKPESLAEMQELVVATINRLLGVATNQVNASPLEILKVTIAGNTTMIHLLLGIPPEPIRLAPYIPTVNHPPTMHARELRLATHPHAVVDCLPGVASYVGADISAGVLSTEMDEAPELTLFIDVGTNGETVLGNADWLVTCACSAGPAFEGAGVEHGMRATNGAIEEVWIHNDTWEPTYRVIGREGEKPRGICGSGLLSLLAELFVTGVLDKAANLRPGLTPRVRAGEHGLEYVVAWATETAHGRDIVLTKVDIDNLMRAKAAIYAGFSVMAQSVGVALGDVSSMLIGGSFGQYLNVEKAVQIGLLPDLPAPPGSSSPWERFRFLGNTSIRGAYMALLRSDVRQHLTEVAERMTYLELSADNSFFDAFTSALFLPHTDLTRFPSVQAPGAGRLAGLDSAVG
jgi:uncharacterized 2Fe-2S/4Fe-4S cluster protein (DUF4445 family)